MCNLLQNGFLNWSINCQGNKKHENTRRFTILLILCWILNKMYYAKYSATNVNLCSMYYEVGVAQSRIDEHAG